ncbi:hypothetical protein HHK36_022456 [Tetracentron sinense]|uniref:RRM domain-containing protein n=1 Tax=Tetracentron sinense TaxID=13715 RepID=A0A834YN10_TETSI|nr:hypothetical protein HHK36_022456 [Tetracentron sinense]
MASNQGNKIFIGKILPSTSEDKLREHFENYGVVLEAVIKRDYITGGPRGFGFVYFADPSVLRRVLKDTHSIDGQRDSDADKEEPRLGARAERGVADDFDEGSNVEAREGPAVVCGAAAMPGEDEGTGGASVVTALVGGLKSTTGADEGTPRASVGATQLWGSTVTLGMFVEVVVKRALSSVEQLKKLNAGRSFEGGGNIKTKQIFVGGLSHTLTKGVFKQYFEEYGRVTEVLIMHDRDTQKPRGFGFISFDSKDAVDRVLLNSLHELDGKVVEVKPALPKDGYGGNYEAQMDSNRYMQPQTTGGGFPAYGSSHDWYGGPAGAYGNSNAPNASYVSDSPGVLRSISSNQIPSSYGREGYRIAPDFGGAAGIGGSVSVTTSRSPIRAYGYGYQSYTNPGSFGTIRRPAGSASNSYAGAGGVEQQWTSYGYNDANGNSGYRNAVGMSNYVHTAESYGTAQASGSQILGQQNNISFWQWLASLSPSHDLE